MIAAAPMSATTARAVAFVADHRAPAEALGVGLSDWSNDPDTLAIRLRDALSGLADPAYVDGQRRIAPGIGEGKKYSFLRDPLIQTPTYDFTLPAFKGAIYSGSGLVQDDLIITSGVCPTLEKVFGMENGTVKLTKAFIAAVPKK